MKKIFYLFSLLCVALGMTSCGGSNNNIMTIPTLGQEWSGDHSWAVKMTDNAAQLSIVPTECDTLFRVAMELELELAEELNLHKNMIAEFKKIYIWIWDAGKVGDLETDETGQESIKKLLAGKAGDKATITFYTEGSFSRAYIEEKLEGCENFTLGHLTFTENGRIPSRELYKLYFGSEGLNSVISNYDDSIDALQRAYDTWYEDEKESDLRALIEAYRITEAYGLKIYESVDTYDISSRQEDYIDECNERFEELDEDIF